jgi:uncharacterized tellurite resistance protein B-like protein
MIDLIKRLVGAGLDDQAAGAPEEKGRSASRDVHLAACAVFLEMAQIDDEFDDREWEHILGVFQGEFSLSHEEVVELKRASAEELTRRKDYWKLTNVINRHYTNEEKYRLVELLWELVYADGKMDEHENYLMHKLVKLLHLTHRDLIDAKLNVLHRRRSRKEAPDEEGEA